MDDFKVPYYTCAVCPSLYLILYIPLFLIEMTSGTKLVRSITNSFVLFTVAFEEEFMNLEWDAQFEINRNTKIISDLPIILF